MIDFYLVLDMGKKVHSRCGTFHWDFNNTRTKSYVKGHWIGKEMPDKSGKVIDVEF